MAMITSIRAPIPLTEVPRPPRTAEVQASPDAKPAASVPVAAPLRVGAVVQIQEKPGSTDLPLHAAQISAAAAADAAKEAYIRASIAAGLNPLPLPGG
jgi:hypothetical protein